MIAFGHTAVGAITGLTVYQLTSHSTPMIGLGVTLVSGVALHYLTDTIPHGHLFRHRDYQKKVKWAIIFDLLLSCLIFSFISWQQFGLSWLFLFIETGIIGCQLPDVLDGLIYTHRLPNQGLLHLEFAVHQATHWHGKLDNSLQWGKRDIWQVITILVAIWLILTTHYAKIG